MRLIDADALLNSGFPTIYHTEFGEEVINTDDIRNAPTVEERPTGKWIEDSGVVACSHCRAIWLYRKTKYCPNCGARMEGEE